MNEYLLEKKLKKQSPVLHKQMRDNVTVLNKMLESFLSWFPDFTDHSALHSMDVLEYCNLLLGEQVELLSAEECYVLIMACYLHDVGLTINRKNYEIFLKELGLGDRELKKKPAKLSGGQCQRVAIARAMINDPKVLFADEPTASLDHENAYNVMKILKKYSEDRLVLVITHDRSILKDSDMIIEMWDGNISNSEEVYLKKSAS